jgi:hypothetical protein
VYLQLRGYRVRGDIGFPSEELRSETLSSSGLWRSDNCPGWPSDIIESQQWESTDTTRLTSDQ